MRIVRKQVRILLALVLSLLAGYWAHAPELAAQGPNRAALVIRSADQQVETACVSFDEPQISGLDLLLRADLDVAIEVQGLGALVCSIDGTGCAAADCWCQCKGGGDCIYWSYWRHIDGAWQYSQIGAAMVQVQNGTIEGWSWGPGAVNAAIAPPVLTFDEVCNGNGQGTGQVTPGAAIVLTLPPTAVPATAAATETPTPRPVTAIPTAPALPTQVTRASATPAPQVVVTAPVASPTMTPGPIVPSPLPPASGGATAVTDITEQSSPTPIPLASAVSVMAPTEPPPHTPSPTAEAVVVPSRAEPDRAKIAAAPVATIVPQVTVIGAGVAPPTIPAVQKPNASAPVDWLAYAVFAVLAVSLSLFLISARLRRTGDRSDRVARGRK